MILHLLSHVDMYLIQMMTSRKPGYGLECQFIFSTCKCISIYSHLLITMQSVVAFSHLRFIYLVYAATEQQCHVSISSDGPNNTHCNTVT